MELSEFSNEFDVLYNNITSNQAVGLDEYEKSVFLTKAQNDLIKSYFDPRSNKTQQGFDDSQKRQIDFSSLLRVTNPIESNPITKMDQRSICFCVPNDLFLFVNENCQDKNYRYTVLPLSYQEYQRVMLKPYQLPVKKGVWRLLTDSSPIAIGITEISDTYKCIISNSTKKKVTFSVKLVTSPTTTQLPSQIQDIGYAPDIQETEDSVTIVCRIARTITNSSVYWTKFLVNNDALSPYIGNMQGTEISSFPSMSTEDLQSFTVIAAPVSTIIELIGRIDKKTLSYTIRYIKKPNPIILVDLEDGLSIEGKSTKSNCELDPELHPEILQRAVEYAKAAYAGDLQSQIILGQASQTDVGHIQTR